MSYRYPKAKSNEPSGKQNSPTEGMRNARPTQVTIPGNREDLVGGYRDYDKSKDDTMLLGHPESAAIYCGGENPHEWDGKSEKVKTT